VRSTGSANDAGRGRIRGAVKVAPAETVSTEPEGLPAVVDENLARGARYY